MCFSDILVWKPYVMALFVCLPGLDKDSFVFSCFYPRYGTKVGENVPLGCYFYCIMAKSRHYCLHFFPPRLMFYKISNSSIKIFHHFDKITRLNLSGLSIMLWWNWLITSTWFWSILMWEEKCRRLCSLLDFLCTFSLPLPFCLTQVHLQELFYQGLESKLTSHLWN